MSEFAVALGLRPFCQRFEGPALVHHLARLPPHDDTIHIRRVRARPLHGPYETVRDMDGFNRSRRRAPADVVVVDNIENFSDVHHVSYGRTYVRRLTSTATR